MHLCTPSEFSNCCSQPHAPRPTTWWLKSIQHRPLALRIGRQTFIEPWTAFALTFPFWSIPLLVYYQRTNRCLPPLSPKPDLAATDVSRPTASGAPRLQQQQQNAAPACARYKQRTITHRRTEVMRSARLYGGRVFGLRSNEILPTRDCCRPLAAGTMCLRARVCDRHNLKVMNCIFWRRFHASCKHTSSGLSEENGQSNDGCWRARWSNAVMWYLCKRKRSYLTLLDVNYDDDVAVGCN